MNRSRSAGFLLVDERGTGRDTLSVEPWTQSDAQGGVSPQFDALRRSESTSTSGYVNLHYILTSLKRRIRWICAFAIAGMVGAAVFSQAYPPRASASTTILLKHGTGADPTRAMATDLSLLETDTVVKKLTESLHLHESADKVRSEYHGTAPSDDVLNITATGSSDSDAVRRANAVAHAFLAFRQHVYQRQSEVVGKALEGRTRALQTELDSVTTTVSSLSPSAISNPGQTADPQLDQLLQRRAQLSTEILSLQNSIQANAISSALVVNGSGVIDAASPASGSNVFALLRNMASGLAAGLLIGIGAVVLLSVTSNRVWRREDVARALRAPVARSVGRIRVRRFGRASAMRSRLRNPGLGMRTIDEHLLEALPSDAPALAIVSVDSLDVGVLAACLLTISLDKRGSRVALVDLTGTGLPFAVLGVTRDVRPRGATRATAPAVTIRPPVSNSRETVIALAKLDPAVGADHLREFAARSVVFVTAGRSTVNTLCATSDMLEAAGIEVHSVVLADASRYDDSLGFSTGRSETFSRLADGTDVPSQNVAS